MSVVRCPHCGTANRAGSNFCNGCGTDLRNPEARREPPLPAPPDEPAPPAAEPQPPARRRRLSRPALPRSAPASSSPASSRASSSPPPSSSPSSSPPVSSVTPDEPASLPPDPVLADQPWLRLEFDSTTLGDVEPSEEGETPSQGEDSRLVTGVQGLLAPVRIATNIGDDDPVAPLVPPPSPTVDLSAEQARILRTLMAESPSAPPAQALFRRVPSLRIGWVFLLLGLAVVLPALWGDEEPIGVPQAWTGVEEAYNVIQSLGPEALVVVYWAYDPATQGEMDLVMEPVMRHLLTRRVRLAVASTLPGGIASARRLIAIARSGAPQPGDPALLSELAGPTTFIFLPGGAAVLPLLARDRVAGLLEDAAEQSAAQRLAERTPDLAIVAAAHAEDAQDWLEQVWALEQTPVVAVTGAGADPILRPYYDSGQIRGLVSGFDGAYTYRQLLEPFAAVDSPPQLASQVRLQNWGHLAFIAIIVLGNLAALLGWSEGE